MDIGMKSGGGTAQAQTSDQRRALGAATRLRILATAERLFAMHGFHGIALRELTREAQVNSASVHYYFGSKESLLLEVLRLRAKQIADRRMYLLLELRSRESFTLEEVITAFLEPALDDEAAGAGYHLLAKLRTSLSVRHEAAVRALLAEIFDDSSQAYIEALADSAPHLSDEEVYFRFHFTLGTMFYTMANTGRVRDLSNGLVDPANPRSVMRQIVPFLAAGFRAPRPE